MCNTEYKLYQLDKTGYQWHQFGVMNVLHERALAPLKLFFLESLTKKVGYTNDILHFKLAICIFYAIIGVKSI
jgi:hypothetical protein